MKKIIFSGVLVLICCLFGEVVKAGTVDMSGVCIPMSVSAGETITPGDLCFQAGLGSCVDAAGDLSAFADSNCAVIVTPAAMAGLSCDDVRNGSEVLADGGSAKHTFLICNERHWGFVPKPKNVPDDFEQSIKNTTDWILGFVGMIAVLMIIWGGINYLTSAGDEDKAKTGKRTVQYAIVGLVLAGIAYAVVDVIVTVIL